ncbi:MAG TPA: hypothetical protein PLL10_06810 [Elusimicrobiales bacterium]|nr:hypothetical protein [Elusimicrobiales bacterium]
MFQLFCTLACLSFFSVQAHAVVKIGNCMGHETTYSSLNAACERYPNAILVQCQQTCTTYGQLGCTDATWAETASAFCTDTGDRMKLRKCINEETGFIMQALALAKKRMTQIRNTLDRMQFATGPNEAKKLDYARKILARIDYWLNSDRQFLCKGKQGACDGPYNALAVPLSGGAMAIRICEPFFTSPMEYAAATLIHEASHSCCGTVDKVNGKDMYYGKTLGVPLSSHPWHTIADTYAYWSEYGVCVPSTDSCMPVKQALHNKNPGS